MPNTGLATAGFAFLVVALTILIHFGWFSIGLALKVGAVLLGIAWLYALIRIPWDLYFAARGGRQDGERSHGLGIDVDADVVASLRRYERQLLACALGSHAVSAFLVAVFNHVAPDQFHPGFVWLFVLSAGVRPAGEAYAHIARRIHELSSRTRYPRADVQLLIARVDGLEERMQNVSDEMRDFRRQITENLARQDQRIQASESRETKNHLAVERRLHELSHELESTVARLTEDRELLAGVKAFARMFREPRV